MVHPRMHFVIPFAARIYNMHQDTKLAQLIAVCKRTFSNSTHLLYFLQTIVFQIYVKRTAGVFFSFYYIKPSFVYV